MIPYFLLAILPVLIGISGIRYRFKVNKKLIYESKTGCIDLFMLILFLMLAMRGIRCGMDTRQYLRLFYEYGTVSFLGVFEDFDHELGYKLLNKLIYVVFGDFQILILVTACVCVLPLWSFYRKESEVQSLTVALFLSVAPFVMYFSGIRQSMAMSLGVFAWYAVRERKWIRFLLLVLLAMQFHTSAFMLLLLYPLYHARITKKWLWFVVPCMFAVYALRDAIFLRVLDMLWKDYNETSATGATTMLTLLILFGIYSFVIPDEKALDKETIALRNILLLSIVIQIFALLHPLSMRMNYYYLVFIPILIPKIAKRSKQQFSQIAELSVVVMTVYFLYYFIKMVVTDNDALNIFPYVPFWKNNLL